MAEKMWGASPSGDWARVGPGLGAHRPPEGAARRPDRALPHDVAREREELRRRAPLPAPQLRAAGRARLPRADRAQGVRRPGREPRRLLDGVRDDGPLRLRLDRHVLRHAHGGGRDDHAAADARAGRQVHPTLDRTAGSGPSRTPTPRPASTSGTRSPPARSAPTAATRSARRRPGRRRAASRTSTSSRPRAPTSPATTTSRCS